MFTFNPDEFTGGGGVYELESFSPKFQLNVFGLQLYTHQLHEHQTQELSLSLRCTMWCSDKCISVCMPVAKFLCCCFIFMQF